MHVNNDENRGKKLNFDEKGKFCKGNTISKGKRKRSDTEKLRLALERAGKKQTPPIEWWDKVAEAAFGNKEIMKAVINKLVPTVSEITGAGGSPVNVKYIIEKTYNQPETEKTEEKDAI